MYLITYNTHVLSPFLLPFTLSPQFPVVAGVFDAELDGTWTVVPAPMALSICHC